jgi:Ni/Fe-hydrogenase 1 B-type cytochrome subunit
MLEIRYVWEWPLRITHWVNALSVVVLSVTGYYIGAPFTVAGTGPHYLMGSVRFAHFLFGYILLISLLARVVWMFIGNHHASWRAFLPWLSSAGRHGFIKMLRYYTFTGKKISYEVGHNPVAATAYIGIFALFLVQVLSGFALYGQALPGGFWDSLVGWLLPLVGNQELRFVHHVVMWLLIGFIINHIYSAWLMDVKERNGTISGIFSGYKYIEPRDLDT